MTMDLSQLPFQAKTLKRAITPDKYSLYRAALEWDLVEPIVIEDREDMRSESKWRDRVEPYHHQVTNLISFCRLLPVTLLAGDVGLGKTVIIHRQSRWHFRKPLEGAKGGLNSSVNLMMDHH